jgi:hypothetical protein
MKESEKQKVKLRQPGSAEHRRLAGVRSRRAIARVVRRTGDFSGTERQTDQTGNHQPAVAYQKTQVLHYRLFHGVLGPNTAPFRGGM